MDVVDNNMEQYRRSLEAMNNCEAGKTFLPRVRPGFLKIGHVYPAPIIRRVKTKYGDALVLENSDFSMFLFRKYLKLDIVEVMPLRCFQLTGFTTISGKQTPELTFALCNSAENNYE